MKAMFIQNPIIIRFLQLLLCTSLLLVVACSKELIRNLDDSQARDVMAVLGKSNIIATAKTIENKDKPSTTIYVSTEHAAKAMAILREQNLPKEPKKGFNTLYKNSSMIPTSTEEKARFLDALNHEIATHLEHIDGVIDANVLVTLAQKTLLDKQSAPPQASIVLRVSPQSNDTKSPINKAMIANLVAASVEKLTPEHVMVEIIAVPSVDIQHNPQDTPWTTVGPIVVASQSKTLLQWILIAAFASILLVGLLAWRSEQNRKKLIQQIANFKKQNSER